MKSHGLKKPTWKDDNSVNRFMKTGLTEEAARKRQKENNAIKKILTKNGWAYSDSVNIIYEGYTLCFRKEVGSPTHPFMCFDWSWDNDGGPEYFTAKIRGFCNLYDDKSITSNPYALVEIANIYQMHLKDLPLLEKNVLAAVHALKAVK